MSERHHDATRALEAASGATANNGALSTGALAAVLAEEERLYSSLLELSVREERSIVGGDVEVLTELVEEKEALLETIAALETERMTALTAIAMTLSRSPETMTLSEVARHAAPADAGALLEAGMLLRAQAVALQEANQRNTVLLHSSADLVERWIHYLGALVSEQLTYTGDGERRSQFGPRAIDRAA